MINGVGKLFDSMDDPAWAELMQQARAVQPMTSGASPEVYAAAFNTPAGRAVLDDLFHRFVNVTRCVPGESPDAAFYREGMAQVVFDIVDMIKAAEAEDG